MIEERRFFLRTAAYALLIGVVYWFVSYEPAGTVMLVVLGLAAGAATVLLAGLSRAARGGTRLSDLVTFEEPGEAAPAPLQLAEQTFPVASLEPLMLALAAGAISGGMVFGAWLWLPGVLLLAATGWHWFVHGG